jgi:mono/diheme cytochrome c family protein
MSAKVRILRGIDNLAVISTIAVLLLAITLFLGTDVFAQVDTQRVEKGRDLFIQNRCVNCHTIGRGRFVGPDLAGISSKYSKDEIKQWIENPQQVYRAKGKMPINEGYPPMPPLQVPQAQVGIIADYLFSKKPVQSPKDHGGAIKGSVMNKTTDKLAGGTELTLREMLGDRVTGEKKLVTDKNGAFEFRDLPWNRGYTITLNYEGTEYTTDKFVFYPDEDTKTVDLPVYEPTESDSEISVKQAHMILQVSPDSISVAELLMFENNDKKIYVGSDVVDGKRETLRFHLPSGASNIQFVHGISSENVVQTKSGFSDTSAVSPGATRIVYTYTLPFKSGKNVIEDKVNYPTDSFLLLVSDSDENVTVEGLRGGSAVDIQNQKFLQWTGTNLKPGSNIVVSINTSVSRESIMKWAAFCMVLLVVGGGVLYAFVSKGKGSDGEESKEILGDVQKEKAMLIQEIAELDDRFEEGGLDAEIYRKARKEKKERLMKLIQKITELS